MANFLHHCIFAAMHQVSETTITHAAVLPDMYTHSQQFLQVIKQHDHFLFLFVLLAKILDTDKAKPVSYSSS